MWSQFNDCLKAKGVNELMTQVPKHKQLDYLVTDDCSPDRYLYLDGLNGLLTYYTYIDIRSIKILSKNMPSRHKIYGNIGIEEFFDINISEKVHTKEMIQ